MSSNQPAKLTMKTMFLSLLVLSYSVASFHCSTVPENTTDMFSLLGFKQAITSDPTGILGYWNSSTTFCQWEGITCSRTHPGRVVALHLTGLRLSGQISSSLGNLTFLKELNLSSNSFSGQLPPLNHLHKLQILDLGRNLFHDTIPDALANCSNLQTLYLHHNSLVGKIPATLGLLSNLKDLWLSYNNLTGTIPSYFSNSSNIQRLSLTDNQLEGSIPDQLGKLSRMQRLALGANNLTGRFPQGLLNLSKSLQVLGLEMNKLGSTLPPNIGDDLPYLQRIFLNRNIFQGNIPASLGNVSGLERLDLENNKFTGQIPTSFGKLKTLYELNLERNNLEATDAQSWEFLNALTNCSGLEVLALDGNQLQGALPHSIGNFTSSLQMLLLGENELSGIVPPSVGNLQSLIQLTLEHNNLSGKIVEWIGKLTNLQQLVLEMNKFTGPIPPSIGNLTHLTILSVAFNEFEGPIPSTLWNLEQLTLLHLSNNNFQGPISPDVSHLKQLVDLGLSSNKLTGEIPNVLGQCSNLVSIEMDQNFLIGDIPVTFSNLKSLNTLNLSHNNLSGTIPIVLADLLLLSKLDLSYNHLQGEIPKSGLFGNATSIYLDGNFGLCGGAMDLRMPLCPTTPQRRENKYYLVRVLIPIVCFTSLVTLIFIIILQKNKKSHKPCISLDSFGRKFPRVSYHDLARATGNFCESNLIGRGSCGSVYRGKLIQLEMDVAIKVFDLEMSCANRSFISECEVLRSIRHRYITPILTACLTTDNSSNTFKALVYVFMPNGNLDTWLHEKSSGEDSMILSLGQRISMLVNVADALSYLHHDNGRSVVHRDLKPSNILIDADMNAYLGDFGIASLVFNSRSTRIGHSSSASGSVSSIGLKGTIGYIAPGMAITKSFMCLRHHVLA
jgi:Leucine-rich repeat (LRR) protein